MANNTEDELLALTLRLLDSIVQGDWAAYSELCDESLTAIEPESHGQLVTGLAFHKFYFDIGLSASRQQATICAPHVRVMNDVAVVAYTRLTQKLDATGSPVTQAVAETRVWQRKQGQWKQVHFHRSA